jgi:hypothetical protein
MSLIAYFEKKKLLSDGKSNTKMAKNKMETYGLNLIPHSLNSKRINLCKFSTKECRKMCLNSSGRAGMNNIQEARKLKTDFFIEHEKEFVSKLWKELETLNKKGNCAVRLNVVSDVDWEKVFNKYNISLGELKNLTLYDYTKDYLKIDMNNLDNYHLTYSFSGYNWLMCERFLKDKIANVTVVFKPNIPNEYQGFKVVNGDDTDERFLDEKGVIIGLKYKVPRGVPYEQNKFVIEI